MEGFWLWLREYANRKVRQGYKFGLDLRCRHCLHWISEGYPLRLMRDRETRHPITTCGRCNKDTHWTDHGIVWTANEEQA